MYTQCPDCDTAFRVTAPDLQRAAGRVLCRGCSREFNALERLTEDPPAATQRADDQQAILETLNELTGPHEIRIEDTGVEWRVFEEDETADDDRLPAGEGETGTDESGSLRWYIAAEPDVAPGDAEAGAADWPAELSLEDPGTSNLQESLELAPAGNGPDVQRYDDNTPLPDDFTDERDAGTRERRAEDRMERRSPEADEAQVDLALGEPDDWMELLDEVGTPPAGDSGGRPHLEATGEAPATEDASDVDEETDVRPLPKGDGGAIDDSYPSDIDTQFDLQAIELGIDLTGSRNLSLVDEAGDGAGDAQAAAEGLEDGLTLEDSEGDREDAGERRLERAFEQELAAAYSLPDDDEPAHSADEPPQGGHFVPAATEEEMTINLQIDEDLLRLAEQQHVFTSTQARHRDAPYVETIIMEGESVRSVVEADLPSGKPQQPGATPVGKERAPGKPPGDPKAATGDDDLLPDISITGEDRMRGGRRRTDPASYGIIAGIAALSLALAAQVVHAYRDTLATYTLFDTTVGSLYRLFGEPLIPGWKVTEWHFEATNGSTDDGDEVLTISSRIANSSAKPLPYPLLHVSLTDRWEEIIGSKVLQPSEYLERGADPAERVTPGGNFTAVVRIEAPAPEATGFKLNVCYPETDNRVRCATEDFRD